jgi:hypothetical protein
VYNQKGALNYFDKDASGGLAPKLLGQIEVGRNTALTISQNEITIFNPERTWKLNAESPVRFRAERGLGVLPRVEERSGEDARLEGQNQHLVACRAARLERHT